MLHHLLVHLHKETKVFTIQRTLRTLQLDMCIRKLVRHNGVLRLLHVPSVVGSTQGCVVIAQLIGSSVSRMSFYKMMSYEHMEK